MERALHRRDIDRKVLGDYVLDETESFEVLGAGNLPFKRSRRDFTWYVRDGIHVRSPLRIDGVPISEEDRRKYEDDWIHREKERRKHREEREEKRKTENKPPLLSGPINEPRFISESYFMDFRFDPGNYYLAGKETYEGRQVLKIDYYPTNLFAEHDSDEANKSKDEKKQESSAKKDDSRKKHKEDVDEDAIDRKMDKTAQVTLWIDPESAQIVKYTFDNVWLDFLPAAWLVRIDDLKASMEMEQPFPGVWLPKGISIHGGVTMAPGSFSVAYRRDYSKYRKADVSSRLSIPKGRVQ